MTQQAGEHLSPEQVFDKLDLLGLAQQLACDENQGSNVIRAISRQVMKTIAANPNAFDPVKLPISRGL